MNPIQEFDMNLAQLKALNVALTAANDQLEATLIDIRSANGLCIKCGKPVERDDDDYCPNCFGG